jgi:hypothetical protein
VYGIDSWSRLMTSFRITAAKTPDSTNIVSVILKKSVEILGRVLAGTDSGLHFDNSDFETRTSSRRAAVISTGSAWKGFSVSHWLALPL